MGIPVVIVPSGGLPVTVATNGLGIPMTLASNGLGRPVTFTAKGIPVVGISNDPFAQFTYDLNTVAGTVKGGTQPYGNQAADTRFFQQAGNLVATYSPKQDGTLGLIGAAGLRRTDRGEWQYPSINTRALWNRDLTNAVWVKDAGVAAAKNQTGADGTANACSSLTWTVDDAKCLQTVTSSVLDRIVQCDIKRLSGTAALEWTFDNGATWQTLVAQNEVLPSFDVMRPKMAFQAAITNPIIGLRSKAGNAFAFDFLMMFSPPTNWPSLTPIHARPIVTNATVQTFLERAFASTSSGPSPLATAATGKFAMYIQQRSSRLGGFPITSASNLFVSVTPAGAVKFQNGSSGACQTADGVWRADADLSRVNKIVVQCDGTTLAATCNGVHAAAPTGTVGLDPLLDHFDWGTNGAGVNSIFGINERIAMVPNYMFSAADRLSMTS